MHDACTSDITFSTTLFPRTPPRSDGPRPRLKPSSPARYRRNLDRSRRFRIRMNMRHVINLFKWPALFAKQLGTSLPGRASWTVSSNFSGGGTADFVMRALARNFQGLKVTSVYANEVDPAARRSIMNNVDCHILGGDILSLAPLPFLTWFQQTSPTFEQLKSKIIDNSLCLNDHIWCHKSNCWKLVQLGRVEITGSPCTDFTAMGLRKGTSGTTMLVWLIWCRLVLIYLPEVIIFESVVRFPMDLLEDILGKAYMIQSVILQPWFFGWPASRKRRYSVLCLKSKCRLVRTLCDIVKVLGAQNSDAHAGWFFCSEEPPTHLSRCYAKSRAGYARLGKLSDLWDVVDLRQNPEQRLRNTCRNRRFPCLMRASNMMWNEFSSRTLSSLEAMTLQGFPVFRETAGAMGINTYSLDGVSTASAFAIAGRAMHATCLGAVCSWVLGYVRAWSFFPSASDGLSFVESSYRLLGLGVDATHKEKKEAYIQLMLRQHPDLWPQRPEEEKQEIVDCITQAYDLVESRTAREDFDALLRSTELDGPVRGGCPTPDEKIEEGNDGPRILTILSEALRICFGGSRSAFQRYFQRWRSSCLDGRYLAKRSRDVFPLPSCDIWCPSTLSHDQNRPTCMLLCNVALAALNFLNFDLDVHSGVKAIMRKPNAVQRHVMCHVAQRVNRLVCRLSKLDGYEGLPGVEHWENARKGLFEEPSPDMIDLPPRAGTCQPLHLLAQDVAEQLDDVSTFFDEDVKTEPQYFRGTPQQVQQYCKVIKKQLDCNKLVLLWDAAVSGTTIAIAKPGKNVQREVWHGAEASQLCTKPPLPPLLANPACFLELHSIPGRPFKFSERDSSTFYDLLKAPKGLRKYFARPGVKISDLLAYSGLTLETLNMHVDGPLITDDVGDQYIFPCSNVWPMGFAWSSWVAQSCSVRIAINAGFKKSDFLCCDSPPLPRARQERCVAIATDDTIMAHRSMSIARRDLHALEQEMDKAGVSKNAKKDCDVVDCMTALGCELTGSLHLVEANVSTIAALWGGVMDLAAGKPITPKAMERLLGTLQWLCLLARPLFSALSHVYHFGDNSSPGIPKVVDDRTLSELLVACFLLPLTAVDTSRSYLPFIMSSDASPDFGFGVDLYRCLASEAETIGLLSEKRGDYVRLIGSDEDGNKKDRLGTQHVLNVPQSGFTQLISSRAKFKTHSGILETWAVLLVLRWISRTPAHMHHRLALLVDAKVTICSVVKGRSSSRALNRVLRKIGAMTLALDLQLRCVYVPSECNPSDSGSRGIRRKKRRTTQMDKSSWRIHKHFVKQRQSFCRLAETNLL